MSYPFHVRKKIIRQLNLHDVDVSVCSKFKQICFTYKIVICIVDQSMDLEYTTDGERLRGKVQTLQKMMQERKMRRQEKRGLRAPYQWPDRSSNFRQCLRTASRVNYESSLAREREMTGKSDSHTPAEASFALEHESVLV